MYDVFVLKADGSEIRRVVESEVNDSHPTWGPDSQTLAFVSDRTGVGNIYIAHVDGSQMYPISNLLVGSAVYRLERGRQEAGVHDVSPGGL